MPLPKPIQAAREEGLAFLPPLQAAISTLKVVDEDSYLVADAMLGKIQHARKRWAARIGKIIDPMWEALKSGRELKNEVDKPLEQLELSVKSAMKTFKLNEQRQIQAALDEEARLRDLAAQKERLETVAKTQPMKERLRQARESLEEQAEEQVAKQTPVLAMSSSPRTVRKWRITNRTAFLLGVINGIIPPQMVEVNTVEVNRLHRQSLLQDQVEAWPGVEGYDDVVIAGR